MSENTFKKSLSENTVQGEIPESVEFRSEVKKAARVEAKTKLFIEHRDHVTHLEKQGPLLKLSTVEDENLSWKSFAFNLNKGVLKFILNSTLDTLPTNANLLQWKKTTSDKCKLCNGGQTTVHVLSACPVALRQESLTWRYDGIVNYISD